MDKILYSSNKMDWETPDWLFDRLDKIFDFKLDAAANERNTKCKNYYTEKEDGLIKPWYVSGWVAVWCNPPYGKEIGRWVKKAYEESLQNDCEIVLLLP